MTIILILESVTKSSCEQVLPLLVQRRHDQRGLSSRVLETLRSPWLFLVLRYPRCSPSGSFLLQARSQRRWEGQVWSQGCLKVVGSRRSPRGRTRLPLQWCRLWYLIFIRSFSSTYFWGIRKHRRNDDNPPPLCRNILPIRLVERFVLGHQDSNRPIHRSCRFLHSCHHPSQVVPWLQRTKSQVSSKPKYQGSSQDRLG